MSRPRKFSVHAASSTLQFRNFVLWKPPTQCGEWGTRAERDDTHKWSDLLPDLIYVAALYKIGVFAADDLMVDPENFGEAWASRLNIYSIVLQVIMCWHLRTDYDNRFQSNDMVHNSINMVQATIVAFAVAFIPGQNRFVEDELRPSEIYQEGHIYVKSMCICFASFHCIQWLKYMELRWTKMGPGAVYFGTYMASLSTLVIVCQGTVIFMVYGTSVDHVLAATYAWLASTVLYILIRLWHDISYLNIIIKKEGLKGLRDRTVPIDVKYTQDRVGEWIMILLGESVISILVPADPTFYAEFRILAAALLITFGQYLLFFGTYPKDPRAHVMWRSRTSGLKWWMIISFGMPLCLTTIGFAQKTLIELRIAWKELRHDSFEEHNFTMYGASRTVASFTAIFLIAQSILALYHKEGIKTFFKGLFNSIRQREDKSVLMRLVFFLIKLTAIGSQIALAAVGKHFADKHEMSQNFVIDLIEFWTLGTIIIYILVMASEEPESVMGSNDPLQTVLEHAMRTSNIVDNPDPHSAGPRLNFDRLSKETKRPSEQQFDAGMTQDFLSAELALHLDAANELPNNQQRTASVKRIASYFISLSVQERLTHGLMNKGSSFAVESPMHLETQGTNGAPHHRLAMDDLTSL